MTAAGARTDRGPGSIILRPMVAADWPEVEAIYRAGIATGRATFEPAPPRDWAAFDASRRADLRLVAAGADGTMLGWAAASSVSAREVYRGVVEHSIYVHPDAGGTGVGSCLLAAFIELTEARGVWTIQSAVIAENTASLRLHERAGFRVVGRRERIARMTTGPLAGTWCDTILIERRSAVVGTDGEVATA